MPARVGDQVELAIPLDTYSIAAFASRRDALFTEPDPFRAVTGQTIMLGGHQALALPLVPRQPASMIRPAALVPSPATLGRTLPAAQRGRPRACTCLGCNPRARMVADPVTAYPTAAPSCWACGYTQSTCDCRGGRVRRWWQDV